MHHRRHPCHLHHALAALLLLLPGAIVAQAPLDRTASLDSLLNTRISTASKYLQTSAEAPASVTVLTSDEIRQFGYRNLGEALENVRGMYLSSDRNYPYLGSRGFSRPTDFNNRILLLIDGHTLNEQVWGGAPVGTDLPIALEAVDHIEIVRGPGSAIYGTSAMFAVINIITKNGVALDGLSVSARVGSGGARQGSFAAGRALSARGSFALSALWMESDGRNQYYPEFDSPPASDGVARGLDWESGKSMLLSAAYGDLAVRGGFRTRSKGIPTASYGSRFGDARAQTLDEALWADIELRRNLGASYRAQARVYADRYAYRGVYPADSGPAYTDGGGNANAGTEAMLVWDQSSRHRLTLGSELRTVWRAEYHEHPVDGPTTRDDVPFHQLSVFVQDELHLPANMTLVSGVRWDKRSAFTRSIAPRFGLVVTPGSRTTAKLLYGEAFRAPSVSEGYLSMGTYLHNPSLKSERVRTFELEIQHRVLRPVLIGLSLYDFHVRNLIDQESTDTTIQFVNKASSRGHGAEIQVDVQPELPVSARFAYALAHTHDVTSGLRLTNAPLHVGSASAVLKASRGLHGAFTLRHESSRRTIANTFTSAFTRADVNAGWSAPAASNHWWRGFDLSVRITNLTDLRYAVPAGLEHVQSTIAQDGRMASLHVSRRF